MGLESRTGRKKRDGGGQEEKERTQLRQREDK